MIGQINDPFLDFQVKKKTEKILDRVNQESETVGSSSMKRIADHLSGDAAKDNPVELWGTRIGRTLGFLFMIGLLLYLISTYLL